MTAPLLFALPGNETMGGALARRLGAELGTVETRRFPDGETYLRLHTAPAGRAVAILCTLARPDDKALALLFAAATARELGATRVGLVAPYLAYLRQDRRFNPGEAMTSREFARLVSGAFDWLATVDPHLHRFASLSEIYATPTRTAHAAPLISAWVARHVSDPLVIGPDSESEQWVSAVAKAAGAPFTVLDKVRRGDRDVTVTLRDADRIDGRTPVLVDDIVSSGRTMVAAASLLKARGAPPPVAIAVHGIFADESDALLVRAGVRVVTSNTVPHATNAIDVSGLLADAVADALSGG